MHNSAQNCVLDSVKNFYECYPYPHYPLYFRPRWQEGYGGFSLHAARLLLSVQTEAKAPVLFGGRHHILLAGCGEIQPYVMRTAEPFQHIIHAVDLSQKSIMRAKIRNVFQLKPLYLNASDIVSYLKHHSNCYSHIDCYGVLHHMEEPYAALSSMAKSMQPNATLRLMVYNSFARKWITELQNKFRSFGIFSSDEEGVKKAQQLLFAWSQKDPVLAEKLRQIGKNTLLNPSRFADTFLHVQEKIVSLEEWLDMFTQAGLVPFALFDRYAELDDLPNPLQGFPDKKILAQKIFSEQFQNNLEIYLYKPGKFLSSKASDKPAFWLKPWFYTPPVFCFDYLETRGLSALKKMRIWHSYLQYLQTGRYISHVSSFIDKELAPATRERLLRLGLLF